MNYYNEFDPFASSWLRELIKEKLIPDGVVDDRSILDVKPNDLAGFTQHHFFAGIGGWSLALDLAGWQRDRPVCTASLPCQPFSVAGQQKGKDDERHLLPHFMRLVRACEFRTIMGEQVEGAIRHGWLDDLQANMAAEGYSTGAVVLGAHSVNAPHQRQRLYWVADTYAHRREQGLQPLPGGLSEWFGCDSVNSGNRSMGNTNNTRPQMHREPGKLYIRQSNRTQEDGQRANSGLSDCTLGNTEHDGLSTSEIRRSIIETGNSGEEWQDVSSESQGTGGCAEPGDLRHWNDSALIYCRDGKYRPIPTQSEIFPMADGIPNRVGILRGAGNAIVPQVAADVIKAFMEVVTAYENPTKSKEIG